MSKFTTLVALTLTLVACGGSERKSAESGAPEQQPRTTLRIGVLPIVEVGPLYVGIEKGYFARQGIRLELVRMAGGAAILPAVGTGDLDIGFSNVVSALLFSQERSDVGFRIIGGGTYETLKNRNHALITSSRAISATAAGLRGKKFGVNTRNNIEELMLALYLSRLGLQPKDVQLRAVPFPAMEAALRKGDIDLAGMVEPFITSAVTNGLNLMGRHYLARDADTVLVAAYVAKDSWLQAHQEELGRFRAAFSDAVDFLSAPSNESEVRAILAKHTAIPDSVAQRMGIPLMTSCLRPEALGRIAAALESTGISQTRLDAKALLTPSAACR